MASLIRKMGDGMLMAALIRKRAAGWKREVDGYSD
jgi:hypothetical protein